MDTSTLCTLLATRIDPTKFQVRGLDVYWISKADDTPENRAIISDVIKNYNALASTLESALDKENLIKEEEATILRQLAIDSLKAKGAL